MEGEFKSFRWKEPSLRQTDYKLYKQIQTRKWKEEHKRKKRKIDSVPPASSSSQPAAPAVVFMVEPSFQQNLFSHHPPSSSQPQPTRLNICLTSPSSTINSPPSLAKDNSSPTSLQFVGFSSFLSTVNNIVNRTHEPIPLVGHSDYSGITGKTMPASLTHLFQCLIFEIPESYQLNNNNVCLLIWDLEWNFHVLLQNV